MTDANIEANRITWGNPEAWSDAGERWSEEWGSTDNLWIEFIFPRIKDLFGVCLDVLEIATGYGRITEHLIGVSEEFIGIDLNENCIEFCKKRFKDTRAIFIQNDGISIDLIAESMDFAFSWDSLVHCSQDIVKSYILELSKILRENGTAFLHHSNFKDSGAEFNPHWRDESCSAKEIAEYAKSLGFDVEQELYAWDNEAETDCFTTLRKGII